MNGYLDEEDGAGYHSGVVAKEQAAKGGNACDDIKEAVPVS